MNSTTTVNISKGYVEETNMSNNELPTVQALHNLLLSNKPSEASHDASLCPICVESADGNDSHNDAVHGGGDVSTYTQDELEAQISAAVASVQTQLDELLASQEQAAIEAKFAETTEAHESEVAEIQGKLDQAMADVEAANAAHEELVSFLESTQAEIDEKAALDTRRDEVASLVEDTFSKEYVEENIDRWASLEAEAFEAMLTDWKAAAAKTPESANAGSTKTAPVSTAMQNGSDHSEQLKDVAGIRRSLQMDRNSVRAIGASTV